MPTQPEPDFLTAAEVGLILRVGPMAVVDMCRAGILPATKPGKSWLIERRDLNAHIEASRNVKPEDAA